jgi:hypothetical protein
MACAHDLYARVAKPAISVRKASFWACSSGVASPYLALSSANPREHGLAVVIRLDGVTKCSICCCRKAARTELLKGFDKVLVQNNGHPALAHTFIISSELLPVRHS